MKHKRKLLQDSEIHGLVSRGWRRHNWREAQTKRNNNITGETSGLLFLMLLFFFVATNIFASQQYPKDMFDILLYKNRAKSLSLLINLQNDPTFVDQQSFLTWFTNFDYQFIFSEKKQAVYSKVAQIEEILKQNPNQPEILYLLSREYRRLGNFKKSRELLTRARQIDPMRY